MSRVSHQEPFLVLRVHNVKTRRKWAATHVALLEVTIPNGRDRNDKGPKVRVSRKHDRAQGSLWSSMNRGRENEVREAKGWQHIIGQVGFSKDSGLCSERDRKLLEGSEQTSDMI